jgi:hypothetical protein
MLAFLHGKTDTLARAPSALHRGRAGPAPAGDPAVAGVPALPPPPFDDPVREAADRPFAEAIWDRFLALPRSVAEPSGAQMFGQGTDDAQTWDGIGSRLDLGERVWFIADLQRRAAGRAGSSATGTNGS